MSEPITAEKLIAMGIYGNGEPDCTEFSARIRGGSDTGYKQDSDEDAPNDEIAELVLTPAEDFGLGAWLACIETYHATTKNTVAIIDLGSRTTMEEVVELCRALKAWAVNYPTVFSCMACGFKCKPDGTCSRTGCCNEE
jgi:hypothetical protein